MTVLTLSTKLTISFIVCLVSQLDVSLDLVLVEAAAEPLQGSFASCSDQHDVIRSLTILAGNPCISCSCQNKRVMCTRIKCPARVGCSGVLKSVPGKCCPVCIDSSTCFVGNDTHKDGDRWYVPGCRVCRCTNGSTKCEKQQCSRDLKCSQGRKPGLLPGSCCLQCIEETGVCTSYGHPHYQTFDGKMFNFRGNCRYRLASDCKQDNFTVRVRNERRQTRSRAKSLTITIGSTHISLHRSLVVRVNRSDASLPYYKLPQLQITKKNFVITVLTDIGVEVLWDGDSYIEVHVPKRFKGQTCGLCGNFNGRSADDFTLKNGKVAVSAAEFGESWAVGRRRNSCERAPAPPIDTALSKCRRSPLHHWRSRKRCWPIKSHFSNCHNIVPPQKYYKSCMDDVCSCQSKRCECEALLAYARACRRMGIDINWGRRKACGITCKGGSVFDDCVPACKQMCKHKNSPPAACASQDCLPGCRCPAGQVWDDRGNQCIFTWMCPPPISKLQERKNKKTKRLV